MTYALGLRVNWGTLCLGRTRAWRGWGVPELGRKAAGWLAAAGLALTLGPWPLRVPFTLRKALIANPNTWLHLALAFQLVEPNTQIPSSSKSMISCILGIPEDRVDSSGHGAWALRAHGSRWSESERYELWAILGDLCAGCPTPEYENVIYVIGMWPW